MLKFSFPVSSASLKHLSSGMFPDMVGFTCYKGNIGASLRPLFRRLGAILEISLPRAVSSAHVFDTYPRSLCEENMGPYVVICWFVFCFFYLLAFFSSLFVFFSSLVFPLFICQ